LDRFAVVIPVGTALRVIYVCETTLIEGFGGLLWAFIRLCDLIFLSPPKSGRMPNAVVCALIAAKGAR